MSEPAGNELAELLWENGLALRRKAAPPFFPPFTCSAAGTSRAQELVKPPASSTTAVMRELLAVQDDDGDDHDAVPWLHCPIVDGDDDCDTAPLPPEYCSSLLSGYSDLPAVASRGAGAPSTSHGAVVVPPPEPAVPKQPRPSSEGVMNFTFFSKPLQRPPGGERAAASNPVESTVVQTATDRLRSTPLFSEQRMAWLQAPRESRTTVAAPPPPVPIRQGEAAAALTHMLQPEARAPEPPPPPATTTTSSVCSDNGDRIQLKRSSHHQTAEWSGSQDEDLDDDDAGALRRSARRSTKRGRTAEVHNMSERRRRDRINEKMRALQELIPNCNKIDKASMLEEAIEYLKTLQLQVQMMSMGTGLCVPPMLHLQMPHFHHHRHLGAAMGLAGFGMAAGAFDPRVLAAAQFPCPMIPGAPIFGVPMPVPSPSPPSPPPPFHPAADAHMARLVMNNNAAAAQAEQAPSDQPQVPAVPRAM